MISVTLDIFKDLPSLDEKLNGIVNVRGRYAYSPYIIMSEKTFDSVFKEFSKHYNEKDNKWIYSGDETWVPVNWGVAIDKALKYGELVIK